MLEAKERRMSKYTLGMSLRAFCVVAILLSRPLIAVASQFAPPAGWELVRPSGGAPAGGKTWHKGRHVLQLVVTKGSTKLDPYPTDVIAQLKRPFGIGHGEIKTVTHAQTCGRRPVWIITYDYVTMNHPLGSQTMSVLYGNWSGRTYSLSYDRPFADENLTAALETFKHVCI